MPESDPAPETAAPAQPKALPAQQPTAGAAADPEAAPAPKAKPPAPEDKPFNEFLPQLLLPALQQEINAYGGGPCELAVEHGAMPVVGVSCTMLRGSLSGGRRFWLCFTKDDINSAKTIALAEAGSEPSLLESFLIDEKKMSLALLVSRLVQRLNGQKWLGPN